MIFQKHIKVIFALVLCYCCCFRVFGQYQTNVFYQSCNPCGTNFTYISGVTEFSINQISSNFERRDCQPYLTAWHNANEYSAKLGDKDGGYKIKSVVQDGIVKEVYVSGVNSGVGILSQVSHFDSKTFAVTLAQNGSIDEQISEFKKKER